jgi:hypothetical protein
LLSGQTKEHKDREDEDMWGRWDKVREDKNSSTLPGGTTTKTTTQKKVSIFLEKNDEKKLIKKCPTLTTLLKSTESNAVGLSMSAQKRRDFYAMRSPGVPLSPPRENSRQKSESINSTERVRGEKKFEGLSSGYGPRERTSGTVHGYSISVDVPSPLKGGMSATITSASPLPTAVRAPNHKKPTSKPPETAPPTSQPKRQSGVGLIR